MSDRHSQPLNVEPIEDRLLPSFAHAVQPPPPGPAAIEWRAEQRLPDRRHGPDAGGDRLSPAEIASVGYGGRYDWQRHDAGPPARLRWDGLAAPIVVVEPGPRGGPHPAGRPPGGGEIVVVVPEPGPQGEPPAVPRESGEPVVTAHSVVPSTRAGSRSLVADTGGRDAAAAAVPDGEATVVYVGVVDAAAVAANPAAAPEAIGQPAANPASAQGNLAAAPAGAAAVGWGAVGGTGSDEAIPPGAEPVVPDPVPSPAGREVVPTPTVVERVIEAVFPAGLPLADVLPFDAAAVESAAGQLLARLSDLGEDAVGEWAAPDRIAWVAAAALVAGGAAYTVRGRRPRRADPAALGTDSALARWEQRDALRPA